MKFKSKLDEYKLDLALRKWALGVDGYNGAVGGIYDTLPWTNEMQEILPWDRVECDIDNAIGARPNFKVDVIIASLEWGCLNSDERLRLAKWAAQKTSEVAKAYAGAIGKLNKQVEFNNEKRKRKYSCRIRKFVGVKNHVAQYEEVETIYGKTKYDVICKVVQKYAVGWDINDFHDAMYDAFGRPVVVDFSGSPFGAMWNEPDEEDYGF